MKIPRISIAPTLLAPLALAAAAFSCRIAMAQPATQEGAPPPAAPAPAPPTPEEPGPASPEAASPLPAPAEAPDVVLPAPDDTIDLAMFDLDPSAPSFDDSLQLYGFADFTWSRISFSSAVLPTWQTFSLGRINLYVRKNLTPRWRSLLEVRLLLSPGGSLNPDGTFMDTAVSDTANFERPISWGGVSIERTYLEYDVTPWLTIRAGRWLTPYGVWNIDHGSPTIIPAQRPYVVGEQYFPERQTGIELFGSRPMGNYTVEYHATLSNGRNPYEGTRDPDRRPALGGRLSIEGPGAGRVRLGVSGLIGRGTDTANAEFSELSLGVDATWDHGGLHLQGELLLHERRYRDGKRAARPGATFVPDARAVGAYGLAGYRLTSLWGLMPYAMVQSHHPIEIVEAGAIFALVGGVNLRPTPTVTLKAEFAEALFSEGGLLGGTHIEVLTFQSAWVF